MRTTSTKKAVAPRKSSSSQKRRRSQEQASSVQVVQCGSAFPISTRVRSSSQNKKKSSSSPRREEDADNNVLDWNDTVREVRSFAATAYTGRQKRDHADAEYARLMGDSTIKRKQQHVPLPIRLGIQRKAAEREARRLREAREAGIVLPSASSSSKADKKKPADSTARVHGPAPSIGFVKRGVYRVQKKTTHPHHQQKQHQR